MLNCVRVVTAVVVWSSFCFMAQAETVWWDHEYNGTGTPSASHAAMSQGAVVSGSESIVSCPTCIGGSYYQATGLGKWQSGVFINTQPDANTDGDNKAHTNPTPWDKAAGYWPRPHHAACPGNADASPFPHWKESGWYVPGTGLGNSSCYPGDGPATLEIRFKWTCDGPGGECRVNDEGGLPLMYPNMQYQGLLRSNAQGFDSNYIEFATWGSRPTVDIGDDWVVIRMVVRSSWEGLDYYIHDDGSMEPGTSGNRGADWQDASGNNQFGRDETARVVTFNNPYPGAAPEQNNRGWKGFETATMDGTVWLLGGNATFQVDYIRWAFDTAVDPVVIPEPATMALVGLGALLCLKRRRRH